MRERRSHRRYELEKPLGARLRSSIAARVCDISSNGAQLEVQRSLRPNVQCEFKIAHSDGELVVQAIVRRCRVWGFGVNDRGERVMIYRAGVEFDDDPWILKKLGLGSSGSWPAVGNGTSREPTLEAPASVRPATASSSEEGNNPMRRRQGPIKIRFDSRRLQQRPLDGTGDE